jgi:hypothetical protein
VDTPAVVRFGLHHDRQQIGGLVAALTTLGDERIVAATTGKPSMPS